MASAVESRHADPAMELSVMSRAAQALAQLRRNGPNVAIEVTVNIVLPYLTYRTTRAQLGELHALMASSAAPIAWSIVAFLRERKLDALSLLALAGILLSLLAYAGGGSVRMLQMREKLVTGVIGLVFLGSAAVRRPLVYQLARAVIAKRSAEDLREFESRRRTRFFERVMMTMTLVWGLGLVTEAAVSAILVFRLSIQQFLVVGPMIGYGTMGGLILWTAWYGRRSRRRRLAAEARAAESAEPTA